MPDQGTRLETEEDVRRVLDRYRPSAQKRLPAAAPPAAADDCPPLFRPTVRPPTPILCVCDDGAEEGETVRIRKDRFVIGRTEGDLTIPNDAGISGRHAELRQLLVKQKHRWSLIDLKSTNGTFVRVNQALLEHGHEFLIGCTRFRFENPLAANAAAPQPAAAAEQSTRFWQPPSTDGSLVALVEMTTEPGRGTCYRLESTENWLGRDASRCQVVLRNDPLVSARHARIRRQDDVRWLLENNKSVNGVWLRVEQISFKGTCRFMIGEQKFIIQTPP